MKSLLILLSVIYVSGKCHYAELDRVTSAWKGHENFACWLVETVKPTHIIDLGVDWGFSTFTFALSLGNQGLVTGVDLFQGDAHAGIKNTYQNVLDLKTQLESKYSLNLEIIKSDFTEYSKLASPANIIHLDGFHTYKAAKHDYDTWISLLEPGGVFLMHDTISHPGVKQVYDESSLCKVNFVHSHGLGVISSDCDLIERIRSEFKLE